MKKTICLDFDGVMNNYTGWKGEDELFQPREGLIDFLIEMSLNFKIIIHSTRDPDKINDWLDKNMLKKFIDRVTDRKPPAHIYLDDRAVCFNGDFNEAKIEIFNFKTHWELEREAPKSGL